MKNILKNILFTAVTVALVFIALETIWRITLSAKSKNIDFLFYGSSFLRLKAKTVLFKVHRLMNGKPEYAPDKSAGEVILTFGGSTTKCTPYVADEDSWPNRLEVYLNRMLDKKVTVYNMAQEGSLLKKNVRLYEDYLKKYGNIPSLSIFYMGINDALAISLHEECVETLKPGFLAILDARIMGVSLLYASMTEKYSQMTRNGCGEEWEDGVIVYDNVTKTGLAQFERRIGFLMDTSFSFDSRVIVCSVPVSRSYLARHPEVDSIYRRIISIMEASVRKRKDDFIDLNKEIFLEDRDFENHYLDGVHLDKAGNDMVARYLADYIISRIRF
ncbi:MAG: hypothetical protein A2Z72_05905 [Omnitrophica bacterium RBG_13_46_9]|nr:MAG: hypothetical protein A2Z72_05905 [Omnitrophica bacterium RBG_13_46_9]